MKFLAIIWSMLLTWLLALFINANGILFLCMPDAWQYHLGVLVLIMLVSGVFSIPAFLIFLGIAVASFMHRNWFQCLLRWGALLVGGTAILLAQWLHAELELPPLAVAAVSAASIVSSLLIRLRSIRSLQQQWNP